ncbi:hypothetical protein RchiOBHm_Chr2g0144981 [Rosa chinensis]|uniref:Uncharacterized protein n=1 Tax=Rosa chinensis TaxID=74649 RepID=A0A2P6RYH8_ROSCH|nr:hypothetical protein RchiOBHm_Chr2g0144981 [Rosa chinensis]
MASNSSTPGPGHEIIPREEVQSHHPSTFREELKAGTSSREKSWIWGFDSVELSKWF